MSLTSVVKKSDKEKGVDERDWPLIQRVITNEQVTIYFMRRKRSSPITALNRETSIKVKNTVKEFEGNYYRTYSFLDLLNLIQVRN